MLYRRCKQVGVSAQADRAKSLVREPGSGHREPIIKNAQYPQNLQPFLAQGGGCLQGASSGGDQIFDQDHPGVGFPTTFDLATGSVLFGFGANINEGQAQLLRHEDPLGNACRGNPGDQIATAEIVSDTVGQHLANMRPVLRVG